MRVALTERFQSDVIGRNETELRTALELRGAPRDAAPDRLGIDRIRIVEVEHGRPSRSPLLLAGDLRVEGGERPVGPMGRDVSGILPLDRDRDLGKVEVGRMAHDASTPAARRATDA